MSQQHLVHACAPGDEEVEDLGGEDVVPVVWSTELTTVLTLASSLATSTSRVVYQGRTCYKLPSSPI